MLENEVWKDIDGYESIYQVSNKGNVKSLSRYIRRGRGGLVLVKEKVLKTKVSRGGYECVHLRTNRESWPWLKDKHEK